MQLRAAFAANGFRSSELWQLGLACTWPPLSSPPPPLPPHPQIAVEGCCHGELDKIYETLTALEEREGRKVDLLICCGDFQVRVGLGGDV
jgi:hypothetical protein